jgi:hypothetical protein
MPPVNFELKSAVCERPALNGDERIPAFFASVISRTRATICKLECFGDSAMLGATVMRWG